MKLSISSAARVLALVGLTVLAVTPACGTIDDMMSGMDKPTASIVGVSLAGLDAQSVSLDFDVEVSNPYSVGLPVLGLDYALASRGSQFLQGESKDQGIIPAGGSRVLPLSAKVSFVEALNAIQGIRPGAVVPYAADIGVTVDAPGLGGFRMPLEKEGTFPIPAIPEVSLNQIKWESLSLGSADALIDLEVLNTNQFAIDLSKLAYDLKLAGTPIVQSFVRQGSSMAPGAKTNLPLRISFKPSSLGLAAFNMLTGSGASYDISGTMDLDTPFGPLALPYSGDGRVPFLGN